ncbi:MAG: diacylglycerol kinase family protein [Cyclobacteriaceae bacterium]
MNKLLSIRKCFLSFLPAFRGVMQALKTENNLRIQALITLIVVFVGIKQTFDWISWCLVILAIGMVFGAEMINTVIEKLADRVTVNYDPEIKLIKDMAAGAVLVVCLSVAGMGVLLLMNC